MLSKGFVTAHISLQQHHRSPSTHSDGGPHLRTESQNSRNHYALDWSYLTSGYTSAPVDLSHVPEKMPKDTTGDKEKADLEKPEERPARPGAFPQRLCAATQQMQTIPSEAPFCEAPSTPKHSAVRQHGVKQWIYTNWIKDEMQREEACLELPFTILLLLAFATLTINYINQEKVTIAEQAIIHDIYENANFAFAHHFGHKGIDDVNSLADFWSWTRLGFLPLVAPPQPWWYSEDLEKAVPHTPGIPTYDVAALPTRWPMPHHRRPTPVRNDYLKYHRMIGGFRFRQTVGQPNNAACTFPGVRLTFEPWFGKPCFDGTRDYLEPDLYTTESFNNPQRAEWFLTETEEYNTLLQRTLDMEDGCTAAKFYNRSCLCTSCPQGRPHPWLDELTTRVEISFVLYNAQHGLYCMTVINFWFSRTGQIHKLINIRSSWAGWNVRTYADLTAVIVSGVVWVFSIAYVAISEVKEIAQLLRTKLKPWYLVLADDYMNFWNCVDWISMVIATVITVLFVLVHTHVDRVNGELARIAAGRVSGTQTVSEYMSLVRNFYDTVEDMCASEWHFRLGCGFYPVIVMLRLFKSFAAQPRLAVVTRTFTTAWHDLSHFALVFLSVYLCMTVNAILFFGQDIIDFATMDRAMHSCFMAMLGSWEWEEMKKIGLIRAFLWFFTFMLIMVMLLLNMLLAVVMEAYSDVKAQSENEASLPRQIRNMIRRASQNRRGERIRLKDIWSALLKFEHNDDVTMLKSDRTLFPRFLLDIVPRIGREQAERTLTTSKDAHDLLNQEPFDPSELRDSLERTEARLDSMVLCSSWLGCKLDAHNEQLSQEGQGADGRMGPDITSLPTVDSSCQSQGPSQRRAGQLQRETEGWTGERAVVDREEREDQEEKALQSVLESVRQVVEERTLELASGVASVLGEEMQSLERRQGEQQQSMGQMRQQLSGLRRLISKLNQTCEEVSHLSRSLEAGSDPGKRSLSDWLDNPEGSLMIPPVESQQGLRSRSSTRRASQMRPLLAGT